MVYAVVRAGGRQEKVEVGTIVTMDRVKADENGNVQLPAVLLVDGEKITSDAKSLAKVTVTAEVLGDDGWMRTGDLAVMEPDGYVRITGRIKDMVIRGGENIYPREIEEYLLTHPDILDVQCVGIPDEKYGEELCAWIVLREGATLDEDQARDHCRGRIAHFKIPRHILFVNDFPMTVTGKVQKFAMREQTVQMLRQKEPETHPK